MIEIEKKFIINNKVKDLLEDAHYIKTDIINDTYYDDTHYSLTSKDWWLRLRNGIFELKVPLSIAKNDAMDRYEELVDDRLRQKLSLSSNFSLNAAISSAGYVPFATIISTRKVYKLDEFTVVIDSMNYGYETGEIELLVANEDQEDNASKKILALAQKYELSISRFRGKVFEYLWRFNPTHYDALLQAGVVKV